MSCAQATEEYSPVDISSSFLVQPDAAATTPIFRARIRTVRRYLADTELETHVGLLFSCATDIDICRELAKSCIAILI